MNKLFLVCNHYSPRLEYIIHLWNTQILSPKLVYTTQIPNQAPFITYNNDNHHPNLPNTQFLFSNDYHFDLKPLQTKLSFPNFDFFSYTFALATESYHYNPDFPKDIYGRYSEENNPVIASQLHEIPFFPFWASKICEQLKIPIRYYPAEPLWITLDIDNPFHFQYRGLFCQIKSLINDIIKLNFNEIYFKFKILIGIQHDPFSTENWLPYLSKQNFLTFFLMNNSSLNSNTSPLNTYYHREIIKIPFQHVGLHIALNSTLKTTQKEKKLLETILKTTLYKSRQHFLKYDLPITFQELLQLGIYQDYTTCFYSQKGYKHGLVRPFPWYDLKAEKMTNLLRFPIFFMDRHALKQGLDFQQTIQYINEQTLLIQSYGGVPMILLHNETFSEKREWKNFHFKQYFKT